LKSRVAHMRRLTDSCDWVLEQQYCEQPP